ncbi:MAG: CotH kinase family protein [Clostridia bacterium]|nr:CotH kinase family protein [Clostridia bacterium]
MKVIKHRFLFLLLICLSLCILLLVGCVKNKDIAEVHQHTLIDHQGSEATCTSDGWRPYKTCSSCDEYSTYSRIPALGHDLVEDPKAQGEVHIISCKRCSFTVTSAHEWTQTDLEQPTCLSAGYIAYECKLCGAEKSETVSMLGHDYKEEFLPNGDVHSLFCSRCQITVADHPHDWQSLEVTKSPDCISSGEARYVCSVCNAVKTEVVSPLGHDFSDTYQSNGDVHSRFCTRCQTTTADLPHNWQSLEVTKSPDCINSGEARYVCSVCNAVKTEVVSPLGHDFSDTYQSNGDVHSRFCTRCQTATADLPHNWQSAEIITAPTCTAEGTEKIVCSVCGAQSTGPVSVTPHTYSDVFLPNGDVHSIFCTVCSQSVVSQSHVWISEGIISEPNCTEMGTEKFSCAVCGAEKTESLPIEHASGEWLTVTHATALVAGEKMLRCSRCHAELERGRIAPDVESMPIIYLEGEYQNATNAKNEVDMYATYVNPNGDSFESYATIKVQGSSSVAYDKKNYTIKFFEDAEHDEKFKYDFGWGKENKYVMKANWVDFSQSRNVVSCRLWGNIVQSRKTSANQERLAALKTNAGAIDGFPIAVFMNGEFYGLYTMNVPKDEWMFGMGEKDENGNKPTTEALIGTDDWNHTDFYSLIGEFVEDSSGDLVAKNGGWELIYHGGDDHAWVSESFDALIKFCQENNGEAFRAGISQHLDVDAAIDYMIFMYANFMRDNASKNMLWATYDGKIWIPSVYDQDGTFGQSWDGVNFAQSNASLPVVKNGKIDAGIQFGPSGNNDPKFILWDRIWNCFTAEVLARYDELRASVLSADNIIAELRAFEALIPESMFGAELEKWDASRQTWWKSKGKSGTWDYTQYHYDYMYEWVAERMTYYDSAIDSIRSYYNSN